MNIEIYVVPHYNIGAYMNAEFLGDKKPGRVLFSTKQT